MYTLNTHADVAIHLACVYIHMLCVYAYIYALNEKKRHTEWNNRSKPLKVEECKSHVLIRTLSYFSKWKR